MENLERFIKTAEQRRLAHRHELERLDAESDEHKNLMKKLRDLKEERQRSLENITKHLNNITAHKHTIHKIIHSSQDISGLPVSHNDAQDIKTMFSDAIDFLNNIKDTYSLNDEKNKVDPCELKQAVEECTKAAGNELYDVRNKIALLETLKENVAMLQQHLNFNANNNSSSINDETIFMNDELMDSGSTIKS